MTRATELKTFLWYDGNLDEALKFYRKTFEEFGVHSETRLPDGTTFVAEFSIYGHQLVGMNAAHGEKFNTSISLSLTIDGQAEVDRIWDAITSRGEVGRCGWCKDEFGLSWQVVPIQLQQHLGNPDAAKAQYAQAAMMKMSKIVIEDLYAK